MGSHGEKKRLLFLLWASTMVLFYFSTSQAAKLALIPDHLVLVPDRLVLMLTIWWWSLIDYCLYLNIWRWSLKS